MAAHARVTGQIRWKAVAAGAGTVSKAREVTMPKLPPPAPRKASRAAFSKVMVALRSSGSRVAIWLSKKARSWIRPTIAAKESWKEV